MRALAEERATLADGVYVAEFAEVEGSALGDGHLSSLVFRVVDTFKGAAPSGTLRVRQLSGPMPGGMVRRISAEFVPAAGERFLIFTSRDLYEEMAVVNGGTASGDSGITIFASAPYRLDGDQLRPTGRGQPRETRSLAQLRPVLRTR